MTDFAKVQEIANRDVETLKEKGKSYGDSWCKRGGVGAFMMLARKWDRIENQSLAQGWDVFKAGKIDEEFLDDISDLRAYLLLVEEKIRSAGRRVPVPENADLFHGPSTALHITDPTVMMCGICNVPFAVCQCPRPMNW